MNMATDASLSLGQLPLRSPPAGLPGALGGPSNPPTPTSISSLRSFTPFSSKVTTVLATSYADSEFRDALSLIDDRSVTNTSATRRQLRLNLQKEVIESNGDIITEFGKVSDVSMVLIVARCNHNSCLIMFASNFAA